MASGAGYLIYLARLGKSPIKKVLCYLLDILEDLWLSFIQETLKVESGRITPPMSRLIKIPKGKILCRILDFPEDLLDQDFPEIWKSVFHTINPRNGKQRNYTQKV